DPPEPRTRRGINRIQDLLVGESVEFNQFGQVVGKWQYLYGKYIGTRTRRLISILKKNWNQVTKEEKNFLWSDIKAHFRLENDDVKKRTLVSCGTKWKAFKTKLRVKFMLKKQEERNNPDKATEVYLIPDICGSNYCLAQAPCDKNGIKTLPPELIDVSKNLILGDTTQRDIERYYPKRYWEILPKEILKRYWEILPKEILGDITQRDIEEILGDTTQRDISMYLGNNISG
ncbi:hypothetical protein Tco_1299569, partial [Tanacetum coccineum]